MKNFAFQNHVLQRDRVLERRVLERYYCTSLSDITVGGITLQANFTDGFLETNDVAVVDDVHKVRIFSFVPQETIDVRDVPGENCVDKVH